MLKLTYWARRGRAEQIRLLLRAMDVPYEEVHVAGASFKALQAEGPASLTFGSVPMIEDEGLRLCQGPVILGYLARKHGFAPESLVDAARADEIALGAEDLRIRYFTLFGEGAAEKQAAFVSGPWKSRWLPAFEGLLELADSDAHFVGGALTHADAAVWDALDAITTWIEGADLTDAPRLARFFDAFRARPLVAGYLSSDQRPKG